MDNSIAIKPRPGVSPRAHAHRDPVAVRKTIDTELDPTKTVTATADGGAKQHDSSPHHEASARDLIIDPIAQEALFSAIDVRAAHVEQTPNQVLMRQRAYKRHQPTAEDPPSTGDPHADIEA